MGSLIRLGVLFVLALALGGQSALAVSKKAPDRPFVAAPQAGTLDDGDFTVPPKPFLEFCRKYARQCVRAGSDDLVKLDVARWTQLRRINLAVNTNIKPKPEPLGGPWRVGAKEGDCNAYALEKRRELLARGWPTAALDLTVVYTAADEAHLVLTVRTDRGEFVLDNLRNSILPVEDAEYSYVMRQSVIHPRLWVWIAGIERAAEVAALGEPADVNLGEGGAAFSGDATLAGFIGSMLVQRFGI